MPAAKRSRLSRIAVAAPAAALVLGTISIATPAFADASTGATQLQGTHPAWATPQADTGAVPDGTPNAARIYLAGKDPQSLAAYAQAVSSPNSPHYGQYLSAAEAKARFGATPEQVKAVTEWVQSAGLTVDAVTTHYLQVSGTTGAMAKAFGTSFHNFRTDSGVRSAPVSDVQLPASVSGAVLNISGLTSAAGKSASQAISQATAEAKAQAAQQAARAAAPGVLAAADTLPTVPTCSEDGYDSLIAKGAPAGYEKNEPFSPCSYTTSQLRRAYGVTKSGLSGKGATVAIVDAYGLGTMEADANHFSVAHGDKPFAPGQYKEVVTPANFQHQADCGDWSGEEALDVEMVHGLAPDANVVYVGANSCYDQDLGDALANIVDNHLADVVSNSWGEIMHGKSGDLDPAVEAADNQIFMLGAVEGIGFTVSSGDCGDNSPGAAATGVNCQADTNQAQAQWPSASPWVTAVGGTALELWNKKGDYADEVSMGDQRSVLSADQKSWSPMPGFFYFGGGGGVAKGIAQPWYQKGIVPNSVSHTAADGSKSATPLRATPDIAMSGDLVASTLVGYTPAGGAYSEGGYGGTSVSSPELAGMLADAIQARGGKTLGFANPALYARGDNDRIYNDIDDTENHGKLGNVVDLGVVNGSLRVRLYKIGADFGLKATPGYDTATGLGTPGKGFLSSFLHAGDAQGNEG
ncbi:serine protease [Streptomyces tateyamensis]|uniref:Serine protease n=1 Tax=Streptomyces tateyamensis TaxID=565073 RepID=A0A2V4NFS5_9ACTN|nr:S53 family peptidase [Streptomyces tateyamensis]PYC78127.1 serine protease [Streptomyces tateyamensis]